MEQQQPAEKLGIPQYRCQRCGDITMNSEAPCVPMKTLKLLALNPLATEANGVPRIGIHDCDDGGGGVAVIIGFFPEEGLPMLRAELAKQREALAKKRSGLASSSN